MTSASEMQTPAGLTVGDLAGVGPELILRNWHRLLSIRPGVIYGDLRWLRAAAASLAEKQLVPADMAAKLWAVAPEDAHMALRDGAVPVVDCPGSSSPEDEAYPWAKAVSDFGLIQYRSLRTAIAHATADRIGGIVTLPWHKSRLLSVGLPATGHTEVLAEETGTEEVVMMLAGDVLRVALATVHIPLRDVPVALNTESLVRKADIVARALRRLYGIDEPLIAFCGLNPHAGESGVIGDEEADIIEPAIEELWSRGVRASGPWPADTLFPMVARGRMQADAIFAMYHDQGLAPLKTFHLGEATNLTLGLPLIRTSVDHGTAYDIAGTGQADPGSLIYSYKLASQFIERRNRQRSLAQTDEFEASETQ